MTHEEVLNKLLYLSCGRLTEVEEAEAGHQEFRMELCCRNVLIQAKFLGDGKYQIVSCHTEE